MSTPDKVEQSSFKDQESERKSIWSVTKWRSIRTARLSVTGRGTGEKDQDGEEKHGKTTKFSSHLTLSGK